MDIAKIESFLVLVKQQNFAKTADLLFISQPALTKRIASLEDELGVPLFNRMGNKTYLTTEGEAFKPFAEQILATYNNAKESIRQIESMEYGTLNFGTTNFIGVYLIPQIISKFHELYPNITINMVINSSTNIIDMLHKNQLEFVFLSDYIELDENQYEVKDYAQDHLKLIVGNKHPLYHHKTCRLKDVENDLYITKKKVLHSINFLKNSFKNLTLILKTNSIFLLKMPLKNPLLII